MECVGAAIADKVRKLVPKIKPKEWEAVKRMMLDSLVVVDGTDEMEWVGATRVYLQGYFEKTNFIPNIEEQRFEDQKKPMIRDGRITVNAADITAWVNRTNNSNISVRSVSGMLSALGAQPVRVRGKRYDQDRWAIPIEEFGPADFPQNEGGLDAVPK